MSISTMNDDLNILQNLAIPAFEEDVDVIQKLDDEPNDVGGLSAAELKAKFDEAGNRIKTYLNETLVPSISETVAEAEERAEAEAARVLAEEQRAAAEQERVSSESEREQAEAERRAGEAERAAAESARKTAEDARVLAEQKREDTDSGIVAQATSAAEAAENAANKAASAAIHQPIVGDNGNWHTWSFDAGAYVDTGIYAGGDAPYIGENGNWYVGQTDTGVSATSTGVYVGSGDMPEGYNLQIDPDGEETDIIPHIGSNGHWFLGNTDLNVSAIGPTGPVGEKGDMGPAGPVGSDGQDGVDGKSAYQYAVEGGYTGTEEAFAAKLAEEMPDKLPNPNALTFTGAVTGSYDGSSKMSARIPQVVSWANKELFDKADLVDPGNLNSFVTVDGVEYYRYHSGGTYGFTWNNPHPLPGSVTITARGVLQYGGSGSTRLKTIYDDGTYGPDLYIVASGESKTATVTTDASKTLAKITGNYDLENWVLLDMSVMSIVANYNVGVPLADSNVPGGIKADPATETDTVPAKIGADGKLYVPDMSGGGGGIVSGDYIPVPSTAEVGQTIAVKATDENGKPTEWEAVDVPSGGGNNWKLLVDFESTEEIAANTGMVFDTADDGTPIEANEIIIDWYCPAASQVAYATFKVNNVQSNPFYFWSGTLINTNASAAAIHFRLLADVCLLTLDALNSSPQPVWFAKTGAFETITSLQLTMFAGTYPVGLKIKIFGR